MLLIGDACHKEWRAQLDFFIPVGSHSPDCLARANFGFPRDKVTLTLRITGLLGSAQFGHHLLLLVGRTGHDSLIWQWLNSGYLGSCLDG